MEKCFNPETQIYSSHRPPVNFPTDPKLSLTSFLFRSSASYPNRTALIDADSGQTLTFLKLKTQVSKLAHSLVQLNIKKNDVVLIFAPNSIHFPVCFFSIAALGAITTTCNPSYTFTELSNQAKDCNPTLVITVPELWEKARKLNLPAIILPSPSNSKLSSKSEFWFFSDLTRKSDRFSELPISDVRQSDVAALLYSSGTTGKSKGVVLSHKNFITTSLMVTSDQDRYGDPQNICMCFLPMFHIFGLSVIAYSQLRRGNGVVSMGKFELEGALRAVEMYRVTHLFVVPPVMIALAKESVVVRRYDLSSVKEILSGAAPLGKNVMEQCARNVPGAAIIQISRLEVVTSKAGSVRGEFEMVKIHARNLDIEPSKQVATSKMGGLEVLASSKDKTSEYVHCQMTSDQVARAWHECELGVRQPRWYLPSPN